MTEQPQPQIFDGDYQVFYSQDFNIYENRLILRNIAGFEFEFEFIIDTTKIGSPMEIKDVSSDTSKKLNIKLYNFNNSLGVGTVNRIPVITLTDRRQIYFSVHAKSLNETTKFMKVSLTFYLK